MSTTPLARHRMVWAFWLAAAVVAVGAAVPLVIGGTSGRMSNVVYPYGASAVLLVVCALLQHRDRRLAAVVYFLAGLAIVYGILGMLAVPLRLAVVGTCPPAPATCPVGFERPLTDAENTGLTFAIGMGIVGLLVAFFGLVVLFRHTAPAKSHAPAQPTAPPVRRIPPVKTRPAEPVAVSEPDAEPARTAPSRTAAVAEPAGSEPAAAGPPAAEQVAEPLPELPAPEEELELPPHSDPQAPELPPPASN